MATLIDSTVIEEGEVHCIPLPVAVQTLTAFDGESASELGARLCTCLRTGEEG